MSHTPPDLSAFARSLAALHPDPQMCDPRKVRKWDSMAQLHYESGPLPEMKFKFKYIRLGNRP